MSKESPNRLRVTQLLEAIRGQEWQQYDPSFTRRIQAVVTEARSREKLPPRMLSKPSYSLEAHAITSFNFFSGHIQRVLAGEHLGDSLMKELMIESSKNLHQWLRLRSTLEHQHYTMITHLVGSVVPQREVAPLRPLSYEMTVEALSDLDLSYTPPLGSPWDLVQIGAQDWSRAVHSR
jgi:hypothetical protein